MSRTTQNRLISINTMNILQPPTIPTSKPHPVFFTPHEASLAEIYPLMMAGIALENAEGGIPMITTPRASGDGVRRALFHEAMLEYNRKYLVSYGLGTRLVGKINTEEFRQDTLVLDKMLSTNLSREGCGICPFHLPGFFLAAIAGTSVSEECLEDLIRSSHPDIAESLLSEQSNHLDYGHPDPRSYLEYYAGISQAHVEKPLFPSLESMFHHQDIRSIDHHLSGSYHLKLSDILGEINGPLIEVTKLKGVLQNLDTEQIKEFYFNATSSRVPHGTKLKVRILDASFEVAYQTCFHIVSLGRLAVKRKSRSALVRLLTEKTNAPLADWSTSEDSTLGQFDEAHRDSIFSAPFDT